MRVQEAGNHAGRCLPVLLRMCGLQEAAASEAGRLLRVLLLWIGEVSAGPAATRLLSIGGHLERRKLAPGHIRPPLAFGSSKVIGRVGDAHRVTERACGISAS